MKRIEQVYESFANKKFGQHDSPSHFALIISHIYPNDNYLKSIFNGGAVSYENTPMGILTGIEKKVRCFWFVPKNLDREYDTGL